LPLAAPSILHLIQFVRGGCHKISLYPDIAIFNNYFTFKYCNISIILIL
jgi:hypothetical protein